MTDIVMSSPRLVNATAHVTVTTTATIVVVIAIATVATMAPPPWCHTACSHLPHGVAQVQASCVAVAPVPALLAPYTLALSPSHGVIVSPRLSNATSCVTVTTTTIIAMAMAIASVATTTRAPRSDGRSPWDSAIALPEVLGGQEFQVVHCRRDWAMTATAALGWRVLTVLNVVFIYY